MSSELSLGITKRGSATVVTVAGEVDLASSPGLDLALRDALEAGTRDVVVDLSGLAFMDVSGIRVLVNAHRRAEELGRKLELANTPPSVRRLLTLSGADHALGLGGT